MLNNVKKIIIVVIILLISVCTSYLLTFNSQYSKPDTEEKVNEITKISDEIIEEYKKEGRKDTKGITKYKEGVQSHIYNKGNGITVVTTASTTTITTRFDYNWNTLSINYEDISVSFLEKMSINFLICMVVCFLICYIIPYFREMFR